MGEGEWYEGNARVATFTGYSANRRNGNFTSDFVTRKRHIFCSPKTYFAYMNDFMSTLFCVYMFVGVWL